MPWSWTGLTLHALPMAAGLCVLCVAAFTYEDEEGRLQNTLEGWWIRLDSKRKNSTSRAAAFLKSVAGTTESLFDALLGRRLLSLRFVVVSALFSIASAFLFTYVASGFRPSAHLAGRRDLLFQFVRFCVLGMVPGLSEVKSLPWQPWFPRAVRLYWWVQVTWMILVFVNLLIHVPILIRAIPELAAILLLGFASDILFILFTRWMLGQAKKIERSSQILALVILQLLLLVSFLVAPIYLAGRIGKNWFGPAFVLLFLPFVNSIDILATAAGFAVAASFLVHRAIWQFVQRPIYAVQRYGLIKRKGWLWGLGLGLVTISVPGAPEWVKMLIRKL